MSFTDEHLTQLKEHIKEGQARGFVSFHTDDLADLITRLEAAENGLKGHIDLAIEQISFDDFADLWNAWRKAAGKP